MIYFLSSVTDSSSEEIQNNNMFPENAPPFRITNRNSHWIRRQTDRQNQISFGGRIRKKKNVDRLLSGLLNAIKTNNPCKKYRSITIRRTEVKYYCKPFVRQLGSCDAVTVNRGGADCAFVCVSQRSIVPTPGPGVHYLFFYDLR